MIFLMSVRFFELDARSHARNTGDSASPAARVRTGPVLPRTTGAPGLVDLARLDDLGLAVLAHWGVARAAAMLRDAFDEALGRFALHLHPASMLFSRKKVADVVASPTPREFYDHFKCSK